MNNPTANFIFDYIAADVDGGIGMALLVHEKSSSVSNIIGAILISIGWVPSVHVEPLSMVL